jgi:hypothetical protein
MNSFEHHGISRLSPSSLNLFIASPGIWALRYLGRQRDSGNPNMWRGSAVEAGFVARLRGGVSPGMALELAAETYWLNVQENKAHGPEADAQAKLIEPMLDQCLAWTPPSALNAMQIKIEHWFPDVLVSVVGYVDLAFEGVDVDLKTTMALPSKPRPDHVRQVSLYRAARERAGGLLYVTPKKHAYYDVDDQMMGAALVELNDAAQRLSRLLQAFDKAEDIVAALPVDYSDFRAPKGAPRTASASDDFTAVELET